MINGDIDDLKREIKEVILESLNITDVTPDEINNNDKLFDPANILSLDSIDAIELTVAIQKHFMVRIDDQNQARHVLESVDTIADFLMQAKETDNEK